MDVGTHDRSMINGYKLLKNFRQGWHLTDYNVTQSPHFITCVLTSFTSLCEEVPGTRGFKMAGRSYWKSGSTVEHSATDRARLDVNCLNRCLSPAETLNSKNKK